VRHLALFFICLGFSLLLYTPAQSCSIAPSYLDNEFGADGVVLDDFTKTSKTVFIGKLSKNENGKLISVKPSLLTKTNKSKRKVANIYFRDVEENKIYIFNGKDKTEFSSFSDFENYISEFKVTWLNNSPKPHLLNYGVGGPIAGIHHGTDCERFVLLYMMQDYLIYLDDKNYVQAMFPINKKDPAFSTEALYLFSEVSSEKNDDFKNWWLLLAFGSFFGVGILLKIKSRSQSSGL